MPETSQDNTNRLEPEQWTRAYRLAKQGSWVRVWAILFIWIFSYSAYAFNILKYNHILGISICVLIIIAINIPYILILRKTESRRLYEFMSILFNLFEVIGYTVIIYMLGGLRALYLSPIYAILIAYLGVTAPPRFPFVVAAFSAGSLSTVVALEYYGFIPSMDLHATPPLPGLDQVAIVLAVSITLFVIAFLTSAMVNQLRKNRKKLSDQYVELKAKAKEIELVDGELRKTQQELEKRVEKRTAELKEAVDRLRDEIRERMQAEEALRESEARFRHIVESSPLPMGIVNQDAIIEYVNPKFIETFGYTLKDVPRLFDWFHLPDDHSAYPLNLIKSWQAAMEKTEPVISSDKGLEVVLICKDGSSRAIEIRGALVGNKVLAVFNDLTERKQAETERSRLEAQLLEVQKLESLGILAGGIAHDFNNLLMAILGNADLALLSLSQASPARPNVEEIIQASQRAAELCRQMLAYSGKGQFVVGNYNLSEIIHEIAQMLEVSVSKKAVLRYFFGENLPAVKVDATQINQVIMNLITNASEALGEQNGFISISTGVQECDQAYLSESYLNDKLPAGRYVYLEVSDTGCGMKSEIRHKIFDPFFTTKFTGRGLGLAAVLGIVRGHKGAIKVYSEPGKGTSFKILLPAQEGTSEDRAQIPERHAPLPGSGTVLLIDDDSFVRGVGSKMLTQLGFQVLTASNGQEGLEIFQKHSDKINCVILDLTMPTMDGKETFRELCRLRSDVRVILSSGYNEQDVIQQFAGKGPAGFVQKPYTVAKLRQALSRVLE